MADAYQTPSDLLTSPDEETRRIAVASLKGSRDQEVLKVFDRALGDQSWRVRKAAVEAFCAFHDKAMTSRVLINALADADNAGRRTGAMEALTAMGTSALPFLHESINHPDGDVRKFIVDILGLIKEPSSVDYILGLTEEPSEVIRLAAVEALGSIGGGYAFNALLPLLDTDDVSLQFSVLHALGRIGRPIPLDSLRPLLPKKILRRALYDALGQTRSREAVEIVVDGLLDATKSARQAALSAFHKLAADPKLESSLHEAVKTKLSDAPLKPFAELLETGQHQTKRAAITLLSLIGTPEAVKILLDAVTDDVIQDEIEKSLARIRNKSPSMLDEVISDSEAPVSPDLVRALEQGAETPLRPMENYQFERVRNLISNESGLFYDRDLKYLVERRIQRRMEDLAISGYDHYFNLIEDSDGPGQLEQQRLINALSTNETYFFREEFQLHAFKEEILPDLLERKERAGDRKIRIWSAGCSSGEEPYTIAILVREHPSFSKFKFEITGTDINQDMIEKAKKGVYSPSSFRATDERYLREYFIEEEKSFRIVDDVRKMVDFDTDNMLTPPKSDRLKKLDVIFCRNVIIYFAKAAKHSVIESFYELLNPGGYLLLGHSESLMSVSSRFELVHLKHDLVYRRPLGGGPV